MIIQENIPYTADEIKAMVKTCEKYNKALEKARKLMDKGYDVLMPEIFPELKESEDERIKETLKGFVKGYSAFINGQWRLGDFTVNRIIDWLEKHNEYSWKPTEAQLEALDYAYNNCSDTERGNYYECVLTNLIADLHKLYEKQDEKKPIFNADDWYVSEVDGKIHNAKFIKEQGGEKPADKVEPLFHVGEWITNGDYTWKIVGIKPLDYIIQSQDGNIVDDTISYVDEHFHLWSIQDAEDGDVLVAKDVRPFIFTGEFDVQDDNPTAYCGINSSDKFITGKGSHWTFKDGIKPATKEQRELLFSKMKEAGYEWDAEKKELKKIEVASKESNDEMIRKGLITAVSGIIEGSKLFGTDVTREEALAWLEKHKED